MPFCFLSSLKRCLFVDFRGTLLVNMVMPGVHIWTNVLYFQSRHYYALIINVLLTIRLLYVDGSVNQAWSVVRELEPGGTQGGGGGRDVTAGAREMPWLWNWKPSMPVCQPAGAAYPPADQ